MDLTFFGLTTNLAPSFRLALFHQIHQIVFHGGGGYDWNTVYNMPIWLRKYTFSQIKEHFDNENKRQEDAMNNSNNVAIGSDGKINNKNAFQNQPQTNTPSTYTPKTYKSNTEGKRPISYK